MTKLYYSAPKSQLSWLNLPHFTNDNTRGGPVLESILPSLLPCPLPLLPIPSLATPLTSPFPSLPIPLEVGPLNPAKGSGGALKDSPAGSGTEIEFDAF